MIQRLILFVKIVKVMKNEREKEFAESRPKEFVDFLLKKWTNTGDLWFYLDWFVQRNDQEFNTFAAQDLAETEQAQAEYLRG